MKIRDLKFGDVVRINSNTYTLNTNDPVTGKVICKDMEGIDFYLPLDRDVEFVHRPVESLVVGEKFRLLPNGRTAFTVTSIDVLRRATTASDNLGLSRVFGWKTACRPVLVDHTEIQEKLIDDVQHAINQEIRKAIQGEVIDHETAPPVTKATILEMREKLAIGRDQDGEHWARTQKRARIWQRGCMRSAIKDLLKLGNPPDLLRIRFDWLVDVSEYLGIDFWALAEELGETRSLISKVLKAKGFNRGAPEVGPYPDPAKDPGVALVRCVFRQDFI
jgi:hypothetical protein